MVCGNISDGKRNDDQSEEGGEGEHVRGQGEDDTPEGWKFLNFYSFVRTDLDFLAESESEVVMKSELKACLVVIAFFFVSVTSDTM